MMPNPDPTGLTPRQVQSFIDDGFVRIDGAFPADLARQCREKLWSAMGLSPDRPELDAARHPDRLHVHARFRPGRQYIAAAPGL